MLTAIIKKRGNKFEALCTCINISTTGLTIEDSINNLKNKINFNRLEKDIQRCIDSKEVFIVHFRLHIPN
jgi:hypothetical protein